jgi:hypothetical protein
VVAVAVAVTAVDTVAVMAVDTVAVMAVDTVAVMVVDTVAVRATVMAAVALAVVAVAGSRVSLCSSQVFKTGAARLFVFAIQTGNSCETAAGGMNTACRSVVFEPTG